jgi:leucyl-tRNA synthetase
LPVELPLDVTNYRPTGTSPLAQHPEFSTYKEGLTREYDTLDTFVDSAFYYLRFLDPHNQDELLSKEIAKIVSDVDLYMG